jgi:hypothetical protein
MKAPADGRHDRAGTTTRALGANRTRATREAVGSAGRAIVHLAGTAVAVGPTGPIERRRRTDAWSDRGDRRVPILQVEAQRDPVTTTEVGP